MSSFTALVLAGSRGPQDPLARSQGARHRALLEVGGTPMLLRVVRALRTSQRVDRIVVSIEEPSALAGIPELSDPGQAVALSIRRSLSSPSRSVLDVLDGLPSDEKLLVTTADHALLRPEIVDHFTARVAGSTADVLVGLVAERLLRERFPHARRTYIRLRGGGWSGANLFAFRTPAARRAAELWLRAERLRKRPWRMAGVFGAGSLLLYLLRRLDLAGAMDRISRAAGVRVEAVPLPWPEAAVDVDGESDLALVRGLLASDQSVRSATAANRPLAPS